MYTILIETDPLMICAALLDEHDRLTELCIKALAADPAGNDGVIAGAIFNGRIVQVNPALDAAFVDLGTGPPAILHGYDIPRINVKGRQRQPLISALKENSEIMVEVKRPGYAGKGPKVSADIGLNGRYMVLLPYTSQTFTSQKLPPKERRRLEEDGKELSPRGKILRTSAAKASFAELELEEQALIRDWRKIEANAAKHPAPTLLYQPDVIMQALAEWIIQNEITQIICNDVVVTEVLKKNWPELKFAIHLQTSDKERFFAAHNVEIQIDRALERKVLLPNGVNVAIDPVEGMTVIDVNSGGFAGHDFEDTALKANLTAAEEIARQIRLRCLGGLIAIDFINMAADANRAKIKQALQQAFHYDPNRATIGEFNEAGVLFVKRSRKQRPWQQLFNRPCDCCGLSKVRNELYFARRIYHELRALDDTATELNIRVHPGVADFFSKAGQILLMDIQKKIKTTICVIPDNTLTKNASKISQPSAILKD